MQHDLKFIGIFSAFATLAILFLGVSNVLGITLTSIIGVAAAAFLTKRRNARSWDYQGKWLSIFRCSSLSALVFAFVLTIKISLWMMAIRVTGSPYDVPDISLVKVFVLSYLLVFTSVTVLLAGLDWNILGLKNPPKE
jgi:hypothetical protein